ncbi:putative metallo-dependent hydrolase [Desulfamplus magnetovallimortis]|uniref:Putative metallo-dependent hydrolase n=1 Tax=Desulfamplus magnetovallimortis TaxID=1246637 RepID=A0A1W1HCD4_9BACT|nr:amidohydrolase family protein [Desulfamplus magnetovallimortis]SLM30140.1 putative metallo-dependent hydrolase [Desulfamplus magnetovallimortis]
MKTYGFSNSSTHPYHEFHRAGFILVSPWRIIENGYIRVKNGKIVELGRYRPKCAFPVDVSGDGDVQHNGAGSVKDYGSGVIIPALVNAHTHFELSALRSRIPFNLGFNGWVRELLVQRERCGKELLEREACKAMDESAATGTAFVGDISTLGITRDILTNRASGMPGHGNLDSWETDESKLDILNKRPWRHYRHNRRDESRFKTACYRDFHIKQQTELSGIFFQEYLGNEIPINVLKPFDFYSQSFINRRAFSLAGHAPHTTSPGLLRALKKQTLKHNLPFSIHLAESHDETEFITKGRGRWASFLEERGVDFSDWPLQSGSPVKYLDDIGVLDRDTLAVHLLNSDETDLDLIAKRNAIPVVCPRSNMNLHGKLPDLPLMLSYAQGILKPALGTDSLASTQSLNMFDEMAFVAKHYPQIRPSEILAMATVNGAQALGYGDVAGTLEVGKDARFIYIPLKHFNISNNKSGRKCQNRTLGYSHKGSDIENIIMEIITYHES